MLLIGRQRGKGQIAGKIPGPSPSKSGKSQKNRESPKKDKKGRTSPDRETPPFETPPFSGPWPSCPCTPYRSSSVNLLVLHRNHAGNLARILDSKFRVEVFGTTKQGCKNEKIRSVFPKKFRSSKKPFMPTSFCRCATLTKSPYIFQIAPTPVKQTSEHPDVQAHWHRFRHALPETVKVGWISRGKFKDNANDYANAKLQYKTKITMIIGKKTNKNRMRFFGLQFNWIGRFLLTVELFNLQLCWEFVLHAAGAFLLKKYKE